MPDPHGGTPPRRRGLVLLALVALPAIVDAAPHAASLTVHCTGQGEAIYLVGGGPAFTTWNLAPVQGMLDGDYRVCRWDMAGVGENAVAGPAPGAPVLERWLADMARVLPPRPVVLWGHSWGALQALLFAERHPERVAGIVLSNPVDPALHSLADIERKRYHHDHIPAFPGLDEMGMAAERLLAFRRKIASYFVDGTRGWNYARDFDTGDADGRLNVKVWEEYRRRPLTSADMERVGPLIAGIIYCAGDVLMPENRAAYEHLVPEADHVMLADCGHFPWVERPAAYRAALRRLVAAAAEDRARAE